MFIKPIKKFPTELKLREQDAFFYADIRATKETCGQ